MSEVDERIVQMRLDTSGFESGATKVSGIFDKLKQSLNFKGTGSEIDDVQKKVNAFSMLGISDSVSVVSSSFSVFEEFVTGIFRRLGERAADFSINLAKKATVAPLIDGFTEYETQMRSIQTISANTGLAGDEGIAEINGALDELNEYADKTIYNFSEMTRNIGTFTAAGVDLDTSTKAIKGISNLAAVSGSTTQQASTAMYQLSQALASGTVKLQDWNSVVNAGMGGKVFQEALKRTARAHGVAVDSMIEKNGSFRESLKEGWITSDILTETLNQLSISYEEVGDEAYKTAYAKLKDANYSDEDAKAILELAKTAEEAATMVRTWSQLWETVGEALGSGWASSFRIIIGDFNQATETFTWLSKELESIINKSSDARNAMLTEWADNGGRKALFGSIVNLLTAVKKPLLAIADSFSAVFGISGEELAVLTEDFALFTEKLVMTDQEADDLAANFDVLFSILSGALSVVQDVASYFWDLATAISDAADKALVFHRLTNIVKNVADAIYKPLSAIGSAFAEVFNIDDKTSGKLAGVFGRVLRIIENFSKSLVMSDDSVQKLHDTVKSLLEVIKSLFTPLEDTGSSLLTFFDNLSKNLKDSGILDTFISKLSELANFDFGKLFERLEFGGFVAVIGLAVKVFKKLVDTISDVKEGKFGFFSKISEFIDTLRESLQAWQQSVKVDMLLKIAVAIAILAGSIYVLSGIDPAALGRSLFVVASSLALLIGSLKLLPKITGKSAASATAMIAIAVAIGLLSLSLKLLSTIDVNGLSNGFATLALMLTAMVIALNFMPDSGKLISSSVAMIAMGVAIGLLSLSLKLLSTIDAVSLTNSLVTLAATMMAMVLALNFMPDSGKLISASVAMIAMGVAIGLLSLSLKLLSTIDVTGFSNGFATIALTMAAMVLALNFMPDSGKLISASVAMIAMGVAIGMLSLSLKLLSTIDAVSLTNSLVTLAATMMAMVLALNFMPDSGKLISASVAMIAIGVAIGLLTISLMALSTVDVSGLSNGFATLALMLTALVIALNLMPDSGKLIASSVAMIAMGVALGIMTAALMILSGLSIEAISTALIALAGAMLILIGGMALMAGLTGPSLLFTASMVGLAIAALLLAQAISILIDALTPIFPAMMEAGSAVVNGLVQGVTGAWSFITNLASDIFTAIVDGVKSLFGINSPSTVMADIGGNIIQGLIDGIGGLLSNLGTSALEIGSTILNGIADFPGKMLEKGKEWWDSFTQGANSKSGEAAAATKSIGDKSKEALNPLPGDMKKKAVESVGSFAEGIASKASDVRSSMQKNVDSAKEPLNNLNSDFRQKGSSAAEGFVSGLSSQNGSAYSAAAGLSSNASSGLGSLYGEFKRVGSYAGQGLVDGLESKRHLIESTASSVTAVAAKASRVTAQVKSPSRVFMRIGRYMGEGLAIGIRNEEDSVKRSGQTIANTASSSVSKVLSGMSYTIDDLISTDYNPVISPVIDPTNFNADLSMLSSSLNSRLASDVAFGTFNYNETFAGKFDELNDTNRLALKAFADGAIDYNALGQSVANALIRSGVHVEMDGGQLMGYLAGEIQDARRMYR